MVKIEVKTVKLSEIRLKYCPRCKNTKHHAEFHKSGASKDGLHGFCKTCSNERSRKWRSENVERKRESDNAYRRNNIEKILKYDRERTRDPEKRKEAYAKWLANNKERAKEIKKKWEKSHPEQVMDSSRTKRARRKNAIIEKFPAMEIFERDKWVCQFCGKKVSKKIKWPDPLSPSLDHIIPISKGGSHERKNTQLAHLGCNMHASTGGIKQMRLL